MFMNSIYIGRVEGKTNVILLPTVWTQTWSIIFHIQLFSEPYFISRIHEILTFALYHVDYSKLICSWKPIFGRTETTLKWRVPSSSSCWLSLTLSGWELRLLYTAISWTKWHHKIRAGTSAAATTSLFSIAAHTRFIMKCNARSFRKTWNLTLAKWCLGLKLKSDYNRGCVIKLI